MKKTGILCAMMTLALTAGAADEFAPLFPFVISHEAPDNVTSMAHLLHAPAGKHGFVRVEDGRFVTDAGPIRFNAVNLTGAANFPSHEDAQRLAARLARFGVNCVRLHYFDAPYGNFREEVERGIFGVNEVPAKFSADPESMMPSFDSDALDRMDYLVAALKKRGIYVNMNLHVARLPKGFSFFSESMIASEKNYAKRLLTHVNPYTNLAYTDEPAVAMIEINNENSLFHSYRSGQLNQMPEPYASDFRQQWNEWLGKKYDSRDLMLKTWEVVLTPPRSEQIGEGRFDEAFDLDDETWFLSLGSAQAEAGAENGVMRIKVSKDGERNFPKLKRRGINIKLGETYTISFKVRRVEGDGVVTLGAAVGDYSRGWSSVGFHRTMKVDSEWTEVQASFTASAGTEDAVFELTRLKEGSYELDDLSIQRGSTDPAVENLIQPDGVVEIIKSGDAVPPVAKCDFYQFLVDTERVYWREMADYVQLELKAKAPVSGTQLRFSWPFVQTELDYLDIHAYWGHPSVGRNWSIGNTSMVNSMTQILTLAGQRVLGRPYTVSEYNHPFPNQFGAEGQPMLRAYGALQGWDGLFAYTWHHRQNYAPGWNSYFFSIGERADVLAHLPASAAIYLRGDVREAGKSIVAAIDYDTEFARLVKGKTLLHNVGIPNAGLAPGLGLIHKTAIDLDGGAGTDPATINQEAAEAPIVVSDTGELTWNREVPGAGTFTVNTADTKLFSGFPKGRTIALGDISLKVGRTRLDWATISLVSRFAGGGFGGNGKSASILLAATGLTQNTDMELERLKGDFVTARNGDWGRAPVLTEGIPAEIELPAPAARTRCFALDPNGDRVQEVPVEATATGSRIAIGPEYQTIWYEIEIK